MRWLSGIFDKISGKTIGLLFQKQLKLDPISVCKKLHVVRTTLSGSSDRKQFFQ